MKTKYQRLKKVEKKALIKAFKTSKKGKIFYSNYYKCIIISLFGIIYSIYLIIDAYLRHLSKGYYYYGSIIIIICVIFIATIIKNKIKILNNYAINKDKN